MVYALNAIESDLMISVTEWYYSVTQLTTPLFCFHWFAMLCIGLDRFQWVSIGLISAK